MPRPVLSSLLLLLTALSACGREPEDPVIKAAAEAATVPCALAGSTVFSDRCGVERLVAGDGLTIVVHHPDGGFRKLLVATDGRGVVTADGAQQAIVSVIDPATIEVAVDGDRYRLPATVKGQAPPAR